MITFTNQEEAPVTDAPEEPRVPDEMPSDDTEETEESSE